MRKYLLSVITLLTILLVGCGRNPQMINDYEVFDNICKDAIKYDIRSDEDCENGHIQGFMCVGSKTNDEIVNNLKIVSESKKTNIVLIGEEKDCLYILEQLSKKGFKNLYYFEGGYQGYAQKKADKFIPETGCGC